MRSPFRASCACLLLFAVAVGADSSGALFDELQYRFVGPPGNRVIAVAGEPGNPNVFYVGAASGGVWKSTNGGHQWTPVFDDQPVSSIGALAVAPSDPNVVWAGTGETFIRANISLGNGAYRSTDGGRSWRHLGLENTGRIGRIVVHPTDPDIALVAALGHTYGPQKERGVFRTVDGGENWEHVLFVDERTGASDLLMDPTNPRILYAGMWEIEVDTWSRTSGGPGSSLWRSEDGGTTWQELGGQADAASGSGLPQKPWGKIGLTLSADDPSRVYALIETSSNRDFAPVEEFQGVLWRSDDHGDSWAMVSAANELTQRPLYYTRALAAPDDADEVYFMAVRHFTSLDGGESHFATDAQPGYDHHDMWIDPVDPKRMIVGHDGGVSISTDRGRSWYRPQLPIAQMYHVAVDDEVPYFLYGNRQDGPSTRGPSRTLSGGSTIPIGEWRSVGGCEVGFAVPDPVEKHVVWTGCYDGILTTHDLRNGHTRDVSVWPEAQESWAAGDLKYRFHWKYPIAMSPHDHRRVYVGSQFVHRTEDGGNSWAVISPDLTTDDPELQRRTGGLTLDDAGPTVGPSIYAIAESRLEQGLIWAGTNDGQVHVTRDGGESWQNVTRRLRNLPARGTISNIEPSVHAPGRAYLTVDRHQLGDFDPYVYRTDDYGATWKSIASNLPRSVLGFAHVVIEDPVRPGLLFVGTESGVWVSFDDGKRWQSLQANLPPAPVHWLEIQERFSDLVVATYGRGFWILDDITPLRALAADEVPTDEPVLFPPRPTYRFKSAATPFEQPGDPAAGANPPGGASLHYYLPPAGNASQGGEAGEGDAVRIEVFDQAGRLVSKLESVDSEPGLHRIHWDLAYDNEPSKVKLRTLPDENPHVDLPHAGFRSTGELGRFSLMAPPGSYTVRLTVGEESREQTLELLRDPNSEGSVDDIRVQTEMLFALRDMQDGMTRMINEIEWVRAQLGDLKRRLADTGLEGADDVLAAADRLDESFREHQQVFFDLRMTDASQDTLRWQRRLWAKASWLAYRLSLSDHRPTTQHQQVFDELSSRWRASQDAFETLLSSELKAFNGLLVEGGWSHIAVDWAGEPSESTP